MVIPCYFNIAEATVIVQVVVDHISPRLWYTSCIHAGRSRGSNYDMFAASKYVAGVATSGIQLLSVYAIMDCGDVTISDRCLDSPDSFSLDRAMVIYGNGSVFANPSRPVTFLEPLVTAVSNYLQVLAAALCADLGVVRNNSILTSSDFVNATLKPNDMVSTMAFHTSYQSYYPYPWIQLANGSSAEQTFRTQWDIFHISVPPAVISITYACHVQQRKAPLNFTICMFPGFPNTLGLLTHLTEIAVLVADLSLFATFWVAFCFVASTLAQSKVCDDDGGCGDPLFSM